MIGFRHLEIEPYKLSMEVFGIASHSSFAKVHNSPAFLEHLSMTFFLSVAHKFSIIFRSGDCGGQSLKRHTFFFSRYANVEADLWDDALSCIKMSLSQ